MTKKSATNEIAVTVKHENISNFKNNFNTVQSTPYSLAKNKLASQKGESIAEALIALLIVALGVVLLAIMISASTRIVKKSNDRLEAMYQLTNQLEVQTGTNITATPQSITIQLDNSQTKIEINHYYAKNNTDNFNLYAYELATTKSSMHK